jgi:hypothetical protein
VQQKSIRVPKRRTPVTTTWETIDHLLRFRMKERNRTGSAAHMSAPPADFPRIPPNWGGPLNEKNCENLAACWITVAASELGFGGFSKTLGP